MTLAALFSGESAGDVGYCNEFWCAQAIGNGDRRLVSPSVDVYSDVAFFLRSCVVNSSLYVCASYCMYAFLARGLEDNSFFDTTCHCRSPFYCLRDLLPLGGEVNVPT